MNGTIVIYVTVDDPQMTVKYSLSVDIISWDVRYIVLHNSYVLIDCMLDIG